MNSKKSLPVRTCVACRTSSSKIGLKRIVKSADGNVFYDPTGKAPGRGAYLCGSKECFEKAFKLNKIGRALRCEITGSLRTEMEQLVEASNGK